MMKVNRVYSFFYRLGFVAAALVALLGPAIYNGFPLVYSDTGTYIAAAPTHSIPVDRPIGYSLFLNLTSLRVSLWFTVILQSAILYYLIYLLFKAVINSRYCLEWSSVVTVLLSLTTGVSNYASQLMPDIFMAIMLLSVSVLLLQKELKVIRLAFLTLVFLFTVISHFSILLVATVLVALVVVLNFKFRWYSKSTGVILLSWVLAGWLILPTINNSYGAGFTISRSRNVSIVGRLIETGILKEYLKENCEKKNYSLCQYADSLPPYGYLFMWDMSSPLYKGNCMQTGWGDCWIAKDKEYGGLIKDILKRPKYLKRLAIITIKGTFDQAIDFNVGVLVSMKEGSAPYETIKAFYPGNLEAYKRAAQYQKYLYFKVISKMQMIGVAISIIAIIVIAICFRKRIRLQSPVFLLLFLLFAGIILNAAVCSAFSTVVDRYQSRVIWLIPFMFLILLTVILNFKNHTSNG